MKILDPQRHSKYQGQPYPLQKTTIAFLDPPKKNARNIRRIFMEHSGNIPIFNIPGTLFRNPRNYIGNFFQISREYIMGMLHEYSTNISLPGDQFTI